MMEYTGIGAPYFIAKKYGECVNCIPKSKGKLYDYFDMFYSSLNDLSRDNDNLNPDTHTESYFDDDDNNDNFISNEDIFSGSQDYYFHSSFPYSNVCDIRDLVDSYDRLCKEFISVRNKYDEIIDLISKFSIDMSEQFKISKHIINKQLLNTGSELMSNKFKPGPIYISKKNLKIISDNLSLSADQILTSSTLILDNIKGINSYMTLSFIKSFLAPSGILTMDPKFLRREGRKINDIKMKKKLGIPYEDYNISEYTCAEDDISLLNKFGYSYLKGSGYDDESIPSREELNDYSNSSQANEIYGEGKYSEYIKKMDELFSILEFDREKYSDNVRLLRKLFDLASRASSSSRASRNTKGNFTDGITANKDEHFYHNDMDHFSGYKKLYESDLIRGLLDIIRNDMTKRQNIGDIKYTKDTTLDDQIKNISISNDNIKLSTSLINKKMSKISDKDDFSHPNYSESDFSFTRDPKNILTEQQFMDLDEISKNANYFESIKNNLKKYNLNNISTSLLARIKYRLIDAEKEKIDIRDLLTVPDKPVNLKEKILEITSNADASNLGKANRISREFFDWLKSIRSVNNLKYSNFLDRLVQKKLIGKIDNYKNRLGIVKELIDDACKNDEKENKLRDFKNKTSQDVFEIIVNLEFNSPEEIIKAITDRLSFKKIKKKVCLEVTDNIRKLESKLNDAETEIKKEYLDNNKRYFDISDYYIPSEDEDASLHREDVSSSGEDASLHREDVSLSGKDVSLSGEDVSSSGKDVKFESEDASLHREDVSLSGEDEGKSSINSSKDSLPGYDGIGGTGSGDFFEDDKLETNLLKYVEELQSFLLSHELYKNAKILLEEKIKKYKNICNLKSIYFFYCRECLKRMMDNSIEIPIIISRKEWKNKTEKLRYGKNNHPILERIINFSYLVDLFFRYNKDIYIIFDIEKGTFFDLALFHIFSENYL